MVNILYIQRNPGPTQISVERYFGQVRDSLPPDISQQTLICPHRSTGLMPRLKNMAAARCASGKKICHVNGDVNYVVLSLPRQRSILTVLDAGVLQRLKGWRREIVRRLWYEYPIRHARVVTTISKAAREDLLRWVSPGLAAKIRVVYCCLNAGFAPVSRKFNSDMPTFLQVGTNYNKNLERVVEALKGIRCRLEVVGNLTEKQKTQLQSSGLNFYSHGRVSDDQLIKIYQNVDALLFTSTLEGFGLPIIEAQATGRPVITSEVHSMPEVAGKGALLVNPLDISSISSTVRKLIADSALREQLVNEGFENVQRFRPAAIAADYASIYRELAVETEH